MNRADEKSQSISDEDRQRVLKFEAIRRERGYKPGWVYFKCKEAGLLNAFKQLEIEELIGDQQKFPHQEPESSRKQNQLTIELVPATCWFTNLRSELGPDDWKKLKQMTYQKASYRCEVCGGRGPEWPVECHEIWHYNDEKHIQKLAGLIALCPACHEAKHMGFANISGRGHIAVQHLAEVNGWTINEAEHYTNDQFAVWEERSKFDWHMDLTWLEQFDIKLSQETNT